MEKVWAMCHTSVNTLEMEKVWAVCVKCDPPDTICHAPLPLLPAWWDVSSGLERA